MNKKNLSLKETFSLAFKNHQKNNFQVAENLYREILKVKPDHIETIFLLGSLSAQRKNFNMAKKLLHKVIQIQPNHAPAYNNLGNVLKILGERSQAVSYYKKAIHVQSNYLNAYNNLGGLLIELGRYQEALDCYQKLVSIDPKQTNARNNLSVLLRSIRLKNITRNNKKFLKELFLLLFRRNDINHGEIFFNAKLVLFSEEKYSKIRQINISETLLIENPVIKNLMKEELFLLMLQKCLIVDQFLEKILTKLRYEILITFVSSDKNILKKFFEFIVSLAEQCFFNEYVYIQSKKEINLYNQLVNKLKNNNYINELEIGIVGCYAPLKFSKNKVERLLDYKSNNTLFNDLITIQIEEPKKEKELEKTIKFYNEISDITSKKVRKQYEKYPYPKWRHTYSQMPSNFLVKLNNQIKPNNIKIDNKFNNPSVLVAGCGTGSHVCIVKNYLNAEILAVDISLTSLAYAKRKTEELGFNNINFLQADILQLKNLNKKFDVIECIGVLHHMKDPVRGLKILLKMLKPHGFLKLGLYSQKARQHIIKTREFIKKNKFKNTIEDIRNCRQKIINKKKDKVMQKICNRRDFYSISSVKDLMFHVCEHRFTLPQISKILLDSNLEFLGFTDSLIKNKYSKIFPSDKKNISLIQWNKFEKSYPETFIGMYNFWLRKKVN